MKDILDSISQPSWWVSVVIVGLIVNLLAAYAKPILDRIFSKYSLAYRNRIEAKYRNRESIIKNISSDRILLIELKVHVIIYLIIFAGSCILMFLFSESSGKILDKAHGLIFIILYILSVFPTVTLVVWQLIAFKKLLNFYQILRVINEIDGLKIQKDLIDKSRDQ